MADTSDSNRVKSKRRNGKTASCEQCRKRKLACDHELPVCGRCRQRGIKDCYYHPAPLTKARTGTPTPGSNRPPPGLVSPRSTKSPVQTHLSPAVRAEPYYPTPTDVSRRPSAVPAHPSVFLGISSSSAVVAELNGSLGIHLPDPPMVSTTDTADTVAAADIRHGVQILQALFDPDMLELIQSDSAARLDRADGFILFRPIWEIWVAGLFSLNESRLMGMSWEDFSAHVWRNTQRQFPHPNTKTAQEWASQGSGVDLRWETIGMIFAKIGLNYSNLPSWDPSFSTSPNGAQNRGQIMTKTLNLSKACLKFGQETGPLTDLQVCLMYYCMLLTERSVSDTSFEAWHNMGAVCDAVVVLGFHQPKKADDNTPFFLCEMRIRIFNLVYNHDKFLAEFLGRPPRISYRHCSFQNLSDLTDYEICGDDATRSAALAALKDGWRAGPPTRTTWRKAFYNIFLLREDILEIALGPQSANLERRIAYVRSDMEAARAHMPACAQVDPEQLLRALRHAPQTIPGCGGALWQPLDVMNLVLMCLCMQRADFLLERAVVTRQKADHTQLIAASVSLLRLSMATLARKDYFPQFQTDILDVLCYHALPAAGVLAIELLKRDQLGIDDDNFPRLEVLQWLSILGPELEAVGPEEGNYTICKLGSAALTKVLERSLTRRAPVVAVPGADGASSSGVGSGIAVEAGRSVDPSVAAAGAVPATTSTQVFDAQVDFSNEANFLQWLGSTDFDSTSWLDNM